MSRPERPDDRGHGANDYIAKAKLKAKATLHEKAPKLTKLELAFHQKFLQELNHS